MKLLDSRDLISHDPWRKVNFQRVAHKKTPKPSLDQLNAILKLVEPEFYVAAHALAFLGCRDEALTRIEAPHAKLNAECIFVKPPPHRTKTQERYVPIHPRLMKILQEYKRPRSSFYFCTLPTTRSKGGTKMKANDLNNAIKRAASKAGFAVGRKEDGFVAHSFRGFFKSHCIKQGIPREVVDVWQGHRSDNSVGTRHYFDLTIEESIEFVKQVDFGSVDSGS